MTTAATFTATQPAENQIQFPARDLVEFGVAYGLIMAAIWTLIPLQRFFYWAAIAWIAGASKLAANPMGSGYSVTPSLMTPCSASLHH